MGQIEKAAVVARVEAIAAALRVDPENNAATAVMRLDALADDIRSGLLDCEDAG